MAIGCGAKLAKIFLIIFNILFWASGLLFIIIGAVYLSQGTLKYIDDYIDSSTNRNILIGFVVVGCIIFVIGFCGCCGAIKESRLLLAIYIILLLVIIIAEVAFGIFAIVKEKPVKALIVESLQKAINEVYDESDAKMKDLVDRTQQTLECCGISNSSDWFKTKWYNSGNKTGNLPASCCHPPEKYCGTKSTSKVYQEGCITKMMAVLNKSFPIVIGVALGIACFEVFVCICAFCLCRNTETHGHTI